jgi:hypothetical protein
VATTCSWATARARSCAGFIRSPSGSSRSAPGVVINTVYDKSDGDNNVGRRQLGLSRLAAIELRRRLNAVNGGIRKLARERGFPLADLERLFHGHGVASNETWFVQVIEPNLAGATAIAEHWYELLTPQNAKSCEPEGPTGLDRATLTEEWRLVKRSSALPFETAGAMLGAPGT